MATPDPANVTSVPDRIFPCLCKRIDAGPAEDQDTGTFTALDARDQHRRRAPGDNKPAAILLFEFPEQFLGGAAHADAAENGHRQRSLLHRFISRANDRVKQGPRPIWKISLPATAAFAPAFGATNVLASMS
jgi:hypothetical protein